MTQSRPLVGIRHEEKSRFERRAPLAPEQVRWLVEEQGIDVVVQSSPTRIFPDRDYAAAGARVVADLAGCPVVLGVKEVPPARIAAGTAYAFFAHVVKGQPHNMPMLRALLERHCHLVDYERVADAAGRRLIFFGRYAGLAGMIDTLWALGQRLARRGCPTAFAAIRRAHEYADLADAARHLRQVGERLRHEGLPPELRPLVIGLAGYGNVSQGAREILACLPTEEISPTALDPAWRAAHADDRHLFQVVFREEHMVAPRAASQPFDLAEYYAHPDRYRDTFAARWPELSVLVNCIYWDARYPRLVARADLRHRCRSGELRLETIGDISCDIEGAIEVTLRPTTVDRPVYTYDGPSDAIRAGFEGVGPVVMAIDNLPCELPADATRGFGQVLARFVPALARTDFARDVAALDLPAELRRALIVHRGELTDDYRQLQRYVVAER